ncbi:hypothetical protein [Criblamydia sequanensis]|uniref:Membrane protein n=1 Tax=Candidatus Criblamydia sequanensis CRIB-18 TaxID=1437425 RepID=A0A090CXU0_9BACT|nr:hypothetical protein [Criblamydia sequanensis]CDR32846.1 putative membrane protein [Criblamydia sequanensis CRIB-18]
MTSPAAPSVPATSSPGLGENIANAASVTWNGIKVAVVAVKDFIIKAAMAIFNFLKNTAQAIWNSKPARYTCAAIASIAAAIGTVFLGIFIANKLKKPDGTKDENPGDPPQPPLPSKEDTDKAADLTANKDPNPEPDLSSPPTIELKKDEAPKPSIAEKKELQIPAAEESVQTNEVEKLSLLSVLNKPKTRKPEILQKGRPQIQEGTRRLPSRRSHTENVKEKETQPTALPFLETGNKDDVSDSTIARELAQQEVGITFEDLLESLENERLTEQFLQDEALAKFLADEESNKPKPAPERQETAQKYPQTGKETVISQHSNANGLKVEKVAVRQADGMELLFQRFRNQPRQMVTALLGQTKAAFIKV